jgi:hypothetical protein
MTTSRIESALAPEAFLAALAARGRDWHESALPTAVRVLGAYAIVVRIRGADFQVQLAGSRNRITPRCFGHISPTTSGSQIRVRMGTSRTTRASYVLGVIWLAFLSYRAGSLFAMMFALGAAVITGGIALRWNSAEDERQALMALVAEIAATPPTPE